MPAARYSEGLISEGSVFRKKTMKY